MTANQINDACDALATAASKVQGLTAKGWVDDRINPPEGQVFTREWDPRLTLGGSPKREVALGLRVFVKRIDLEAAQRTLRNFMEQDGPTSVIEALENDKYWPSDVDYVEVVEVGRPFETTAADATYLAVDFAVNVTL